MQEILQVLDGTTGLNMLPQAREFNEVMFLSFTSWIILLLSEHRLLIDSISLCNLFLHNKFVSVLILYIINIVTDCWDNWFDIDKT